MIARKQPQTFSDLINARVDNTLRQIQVLCNHNSRLNKSIKDRFLFVADFKSKKIQALNLIFFVIYHF
jgi:hypothetical protein